jgi:hypothetical protein
MPPVLRVHNGTGANPPSASGAGPGDGTTSGSALTGTNASYSGFVVTLDGSPDLTPVLTTGDHVLYLGTSTGRRFFTITAKDNTAKTVTVSETIAGTTTGRSWAIGGKLAAISNANAAVLYASGGDIRPGWTVQFDSGHTETFSGRWDVFGGGDLTAGPVVYQGEPGAATRPIITLSGGSADIVPRGAYTEFSGFNITGTGGPTRCFVTVAQNVVYFDLSVTGFSTVIFDDNLGTGLIGCSVVGCRTSGGSVAIRLTDSSTAYYNHIVSPTSHGIEVPSENLFGVSIVGNVVSGAGGDGIRVLQTRDDGLGSVTICENTVNGSTGDGIDYTGDLVSLANFRCYNNILSNNGGFGINFSSLTAAKVLAYGCRPRGNATFNNTSGACNLTGVLRNGTDGVDPGYVSAGSGNFAIGTGLRALGYPTNGIGPAATTLTYIDPGAAQRQEPAGGSAGARLVGPSALVTPGGIV